MKKQIFISLFILIFSAFFLTGCTSTETIDLSQKLVEQANELYGKREYKSAIEKYGEALNEYPANNDAYVGVVTILLEKGYVSEAENVASEASVRLENSESAELYVLIGDKYFENGDLDNARKTYEEALAFDNSLYEGIISLVNMNIKNGKLEDARTNLEKVSSNEKEQYEYLILKAYLSLEDFDKGAESINKVDISEIDREEVKEQVRLLKEVYDLDTDELHQKAYLAKEYINVGYPYLAIVLLEDNAEKIEEYWEGQYFLGKAYLDYGDYDKALTHLNNAVALDVDDVDMYASLGRAYLGKDNIDKSVQAYKKAVSLMEIAEHSYLVHEYITVLIDNNMLNSARTTLVDLLALEKYPWIYILLCEVSYQQKNMAQLSEYIRELEALTLSVGEEKTLTRYRLLYALNDIRDVIELAELIQKYKNFDEYNAESFLMEGQFLLHKAENESAVEALNRAIELDLDGSVTEDARKQLATLK